MKQYIEDNAKFIDEIWHSPAQNSYPPLIKEISEKFINGLNSGVLRIADYNKDNDEWVVNELYKKLILIYFKTHQSVFIPSTVHPYYDKVPVKFADWQLDDFTASKIRAIPGCFIRSGCFIGENVVLMPCFVNIGAYIGNNCMIDTWSSIGSCAQIGNNCHISGGAGIGGVLEPIQANPVIIEDDCFIGARSEIAEGVIVKQGAVIAMGVYLTKSTKIINKLTGEIHQGYVPPYSVVVPGSYEVKPGLSQYCAVIIKQVDASTRAKTSINELLR